MDVFVTGASGYIGGSVAARLMEQGATVSGLARSDAAAETLEARGIGVVRGTLASWSVLQAAAQRADAVVDAADADDAFAASCLIEALRGSGKRLLHTSGSSVVGDMAAGAFAGALHTEDSLVAPRFEKAGRVAIDRAVLQAALDGVHGVVICPTMIYGDGLGTKRDSIQVPWLIEIAIESGAGRHVGAGENLRSTVHVADLADLYVLAIERAPAGSFFFAESGACRLGDIAAAIGRMLGFGERTEALSLTEAAERWGAEAAHFAFGSNSRVSAEKARRLLGWTPSRPGLIEEIEQGCYRRAPAMGST